MDVPLRDAALVAVKQCANSLLAMLLVNALLIAPPIRRRVGRHLPAPLQSVTLADTMATALLLGTVLPLVLFGAVEGRARYVTERLRIDERNSAIAQRAAESVERDRLVN